jgi:hypothetical protein
VRRRGDEGEHPVNAVSDRVLDPDGTECGRHRPEVFAVYRDGAIVPLPVVTALCLEKKGVATLLSSDDDQLLLFVDE